MNECHAAALSRLIVDHIRLVRSRCETLGWLIASILTAGTVNLTRLAPHIDLHPRGRPHMHQCPAHPVGKTAVRRSAAQPTSTGPGST